jgi:Ion channel
MVFAIFIATLLVLGSFCIHQASLAVLAKSISLSKPSSHPRLYLLMLGVFVTHLFEIILYAAGYYVADHILSLGVLVGENVEGFLGHFYASAVIYTSLGFGDILPSGHLRFIAAVEALNGLLLIAWSASFLFTVMGQYWSSLICETPDETEKEQSGCCSKPD